MGQGQYKILLLFLLIITFSFSACKNGQSKHTETPPLPEKEKPVVVLDTCYPDTNYIHTLKELRLHDPAITDYASAKIYAKQVRERLSAPGISTDSISKAFKRVLLNVIIPFWEGTQWSFEGHTSVPGTGWIACGYFVSTTLQDAGLNINRYKLAQQYPGLEAKSLALGQDVMNVFGDSTVTIIRTLQEMLSEGIHFIGFGQSHVGYILKDHGKLYVIHSNYLEPDKGVMIEPLRASEVFASYTWFSVVPLSTNDALLKAWVSGTSIRIFTEE